jgi:hypothetical protein
MGRWRRNRPAIDYAEVKSSFVDGHSQERTHDFRKGHGSKGDGTDDDAASSQAAINA